MGRLILDLGSARLASATAPSEADSAPAHHGRHEVLRWEGRGWVNSEASNGLSSPRWLQRAQGQGRDEKRPSWGTQRAACDVRMPELECGAAQSTAALMNVK